MKSEKCPLQSLKCPMVCDAPIKTKQNLPYMPVVPIQYRFMINGISMIPKEKYSQFFKRIKEQTNNTYDDKSYWVLERETEQYAICYQPKYDKKKWDIDRGWVIQHGPTGIELDWDCISFVSPESEFGHQVYRWFATYEECYYTIQKLADVTGYHYCIYSNRDNHPAFMSLEGCGNQHKWDKERHLWERVYNVQNRRGVQYTAQLVRPTVAKDICLATYVNPLENNNENNKV